jgi:hypothetical protein
LIYDCEFGIIPLPNKFGMFYYLIHQYFLTLT